MRTEVVLAGVLSGKPVLDVAVTIVVLAILVPLRLWAMNRNRRR